MARQLIAHVHVYDGDGRAHVFGPGDNVPDELAKRITNPAVWESNRGGRGVNEGVLWGGAPTNTSPNSPKTHTAGTPKSSQRRERGR
ncbi:hypothetical protein, partial [Nocardia farcinica]|uniref:hypothetical protein n=1 Tax=Nocardia farcinica TaxID=37329 RepID=UPI00245429F6